MTHKLSFLILAVTMTATVACNEDGDDDAVCIDVLEPDAADASPDCTARGTLPAGSCRTENDCTDGMTCFVPGRPQCGTCMEGPVPCSSDDECPMSGNQAMVCDFQVEDTCYCDWGTSCMLKCGIEGGLVCSNPNRPACIDGHCVATPCASDSGCPGTFTCQGETDDMASVRRTCTVDDECGDCGWCVDGMCYDEPGTCEYMAP